jgi:hypothetical protein
MYKFFQKRLKKVVSLVALFTMLFQNVAPVAVLGVQVYAQEVAQSHVEVKDVALGFDEANHEFTVAVKSENDQEYLLEYKTQVEDSEEKVTKGLTGLANSQEGVAKASFYAGTCSGEDCVPDEVTEGTLKLPGTDYEANFKMVDTHLWLQTGKVASITGLEVGQAYVAPQNSELEVTFTELPENPGNLYIEEVELSAEQQELLGAYSNVAYDITSDMDNGSFKYDLKLPLPEGADAQLQVKYAESVEELDAAQEVESVEIDENEKEVKIEDLNHMTIFVVVETVHSDMGITYPFEGDDDNLGDVWLYRSSNGASTEVITDPTDAVAEFLGDQVVEMDAPGLGRSYLGYTGFTGQSLSDINLEEISWHKYADQTTNDHYLNIFFRKSFSSVDYGYIAIIPNCNLQDEWQVCTTDDASFRVKHYYYSTQGWPWNWGWRSTEITYSTLANLVNSEYGTWILRNDFETGSSLVLTSGSSTTGSDLHNYVDGVRFDYQNEDFDLHNFETELDLERPTVEITSSVNNSTKNKTNRFEVTFSEEVSDLDNSDLEIVNATINSNSLVRISETVFEVYLTAIVDGEVSLKIKKDSVFDNSGHGNQESDTYTILVDSTSPVVEIIQPTENEVLGGNIAVTVNASDNVGMGSYYIRLWKDTAYQGNLMGNCQSAPGGNGLGDQRTDNCIFDTSSLEDGNYVVTAQYLDSSVNWGSDQLSITLDNTYPQIENTVMYVNGVESRLVKPGDVIKISTQVNDNLSNIDKVQIWVREYPWSPSHNELISGNMNNPSSNVWEFEFVVPDNYKDGDILNEDFEGNYFNFRPYDAVGNSHIGWRENFTIDNTAPELSIDSLKYDSGTVEPTKFVTNDNTPLVLGTLISDDIASLVLSVNGHNYPATLNGTTWEAQVTDDLPEGSHVLTATATDHAGNTHAETQKIFIDTVAPTADHTYYKGGVAITDPIAYGKALSDFTFTGEYTDSDPSSQLYWDSFVIFQAQDDGSFRFSHDGKKSYCGWRSYPNLLDLSGITDSVTTPVEFTDCVSTIDEGEYYMAHHIYDRATRKDIPSINQFRDVLGLHFIIDKTNPETTLTVPTDSFETNQPIMIEGTSSDDKLLDFVSLYYSPVGENNWSLITTIDTGDVNSYDFSYEWTPSVDGEYDIKAAATDKAGNEEQSAYAYGVIYDTTKPEITWENPDETEWVSATTALEAICDGGLTESTYVNFWWWKASEGQTVPDARDGSPKQYNRVSRTNLNGGSIVGNLFGFDLGVGNEDIIQSEYDWDGVWKLRAACKDAVGNYNHVEQDLLVDLQAPSSEITTFDLPNGGEVETASFSGLIEGTATDGSGSGVDHVLLEISHIDFGGVEADRKYWDATASAWINTSSTFRADGVDPENWNYQLPAAGIVEGFYTITSHAVDKVGNVEQTYTITIIYDKTIPEVTVTMDPVTPTGTNDWYLVEPKVSLSATDNYKLDRIEYQWGSTAGTWITYTGTLTPPGEGQNLLYYRGVDVVGNKAETTTDIGLKVVKYDLTNPEAPINVRVDSITSEDAMGYWEKPDDGSDIERYSLRWTHESGDSKGITVGKDDFEELLTDLYDGEWTFTVRAQDDAGNFREASTKFRVGAAPAGDEGEVLGATDDQTGLGGLVAGIFTGGNDQDSEDDDQTEEETQNPEGSDTEGQVLGTEDYFCTGWKLYLPFILLALQTLVVTAVEYFNRKNFKNALLMALGATIIFSVLYYVLRDGQCFAGDSFMSLVNKWFIAVSVLLTAFITTIFYAFVPGEE